MNIFTSLKYPFRVWQLFALSPFSLNKNLEPRESLTFKLYTVFSIFVHIVVSIQGLIAIPTYQNRNNSVVLLYNGVFMVFAIQLLSCVMLIEAFLKRKHHIDFFERINTVDSILKHKLQIKIDYKKYQCQTSAVSLAWLLTYLTVEVIMIVKAHIKKYYTYQRGQLYLLFPTLMSTMLCHQIVTFQHIIRSRYVLINDFVRKILLFQSKGDVNRELLTATRNFEFSLDQKGQTLSCSQFQQMRVAYKLMYESTVIVNNLFLWSVPLFTGIYFHKILLTTFAFVATILVDSPFDQVGLLIMDSFFIAQIILLSHACQAVSNEVRITMLNYCLMGGIAKN